MKQLRRLPEFLRFVLVGVFATALHYGIYFLLQKFINVNIPSWGKAFGFGGAHLFNYLLHIGLLNTFLWLGLSKTTAPAPVFAIAIPVNFLLVRFVFKHKG